MRDAKKNLKLCWPLITVVALVLWLLFGFSPLALGFFGIVSLEQIQNASPVGEMFGAASAFFSGFALIALLMSIQIQSKALEAQKEQLENTRSELKHSVRAQYELVRQHQQALTHQTVMPIMDQIGSEAFRQASQLLGDTEREGKIAEFQELRRRTNLDESKKAALDRIDGSRRQFVQLFHRIFRLRKAGVVDDEMVRRIITPDLVWTLLYIDEPMEEAIRMSYNHEIFKYFQSLYALAEVEAQWPRNKQNPLSRRLEKVLSAQAQDAK